MSKKQNLKSAGELSPKQYSEYLNKVSLNSINTISFSASIDRKKLKPEIKPSVSVNDKYSLDIKSNSTKAIINYSLSVTPENSKTVILSINISFEVLLDHQLNIPKTFWDIYKSATLPLIVWPYFREFVQNTTARMNVPPLTLPLLFR